MIGDPSTTEIEKIEQGAKVYLLTFRGAPKKMQSQSTLEPILGEQSLLILAGGVFLLLVAAAISFTIVLKSDPGKIRAFRGGRALHYVTIVSVVFSTVVLGLERILAGEAVASILGGIIGYVLGTLKEKTTSSPQENPESLNVR